MNDIVLNTICDDVDNYVKVLCLLCFVMWITGCCVRVVRTLLAICLRDTDSMCLCVTDKNRTLDHSVFCMYSPL